MNDSVKRKEFAVAAIRYSPLTLSLFAVVVTLTTGCTCTAISNHQWVGRRAPEVSKPEDFAKYVRQSVNSQAGGFARATGFLSTPFKRIGIFGWSDLGYDAEVSGMVKQAVKSTDQFYTVDMKLETLRIDGRDIPLTDERYLRAEICLCEVKLDEKERPKKGEKVWMRGRMVWDGDGFVEIHPRSAAEVRKQSP